MYTFLESNQRTENSEKCLDPELWHACAGAMVHMPPVNSTVFYFPQGHLEHASGNVDSRNYPRLPPYVPCTVSTIKFVADPHTDEVFSKITLTPFAGNAFDFDNDDGGISPDHQTNPALFSAKTLTQSDANNGGGFSVPRYCAETVFPKLDLSSDPPSQNIHVKDVHGEIWTFRHIYRGTPRRHLLTTGWSNFVNHKKLIAGDSVVFMRAGPNGDLCVGIRRAKNPTAGFSPFSNDSNANGNGRGRLRVEDVIEAAGRAASGKPFEVVYYPRGGGPEFCVRASLVKAAMRVRWAPGLRFKMAFETEDWTRTSWFMGTVISVQVADPVRWPDSPWRLLQVRWDEPDLLQDVKHVSPWLVELVPTIDLSPFSPPLKRLKLPHHLEFKGQIPLPAFSNNNQFLDPNNPLGCFLDNNAPAGMQGARHTPYGPSLPPSLNLSGGKLQPSLFPDGFTPTRPNESVSRLPESKKSDDDDEDDAKTAKFVLFGQPILTEEQMSKSCSNSSSDCNADGPGSGSGLNRNDGPERSSREGNFVKMARRLTVVEADSTVMM
ncbi:auxin response factor 18 [Phtheirospermum japonicum]|uniref:Auxin response factor n=1 Tax=Phtheirospermum japonicum TaxID=374723 RepID=A0A830C4B6_9LAMI|nr:auxin response factor 18 [Phtheirospermum japonicum]